MFKYKYIGTSEVSVEGVGLVKPGETVESEVEINKPEFEPVGENKKKKKDED